MKNQRCAYFFVVAQMLLLPVQALATPTITCHCFTDRSYDPKHPTLADPYFLASAQNSFFAAAFGVDKKSIVMKKQQGAASDDLWISYWLSSQTGVSQEQLVRQRKNQASWYQVAKLVNISLKTPDPVIAGILQKNATDARLAEAVVDSLLLRHRLLQESVLSKMRKGGAGSKEMIIAALIAAKTGADPEQIFRDVREGASSWGEKLQQAKINSQNLQQEITALLR